MKKISKIYILACLQFLFVTSCNNPHQINVKLKTKMLDLTMLIPFKIDNNVSYVNVSLIEVYPTSHKCDNDKRYVNLYVCRNDNSRDTLLVFESCKTVPDYLTPTSKYKNQLSFNNRDVLKATSRIIFADLPELYKFPKNARYIFVPLQTLSE